MCIFIRILRTKNLNTDKCTPTNVIAAVALLVVLAVPAAYWGRFVAANVALNQVVGDKKYISTFKYLLNALP